MKEKRKIGIVAFLCIFMIFFVGSCSKKKNKIIKQKEVFVVVKDLFGFYGFVTPEDKKISPKEGIYVYQGAMPFSEGMAGVKIGDKWGFVNKKLDLVIPSKFDDVCSFSEGLARVSVDGNWWGFVNKKGKLVIPAVYKDAMSFKNGLAVVQKDGSCGMINQKGEVVVPFDYSYIENWETDNMIRVESQGKWGLLDGKTGNPITPLEYDDISSFYEDLSCVKKGRFHGYIDKKGKTVIQLVYDETKVFSEGYGAVKKDGLWGFIGKDGLTKIPFEYENVGSFSEGLAAVQKDGKVGFVNKIGNLSIPAKYEPMKDNFGTYYPCFSEGLAAVQKDGKIGYIDKSGNAVIPFSFTDAGNFHDGIAKACKGFHKWGIINKSGETIVNFEHADIILYEEIGLIIADDVMEMTIFNFNGTKLSKHDKVVGLSCPDSSNVRYDIGGFSDQIDRNWKEIEKNVYGE